MWHVFVCSYPIVGKVGDYTKIIKMDDLDNAGLKT